MSPEGEINLTVWQERKSASCMTRSTFPKGLRPDQAGPELGFHPSLLGWHGLSLEVHPTLLHTRMDDNVGIEAGNVPEGKDGYRVAGGWGGGQRRVWKE